MKKMFYVLVAFGLLLFAAGCGGGKAIDGNFDNPSGSTVTSIGDSSDIVAKGSTSILRALTIMDGLIINQAYFFSSLQFPQPNYNLTGTYPVKFGAADPVQFTYRADVTPNGVGIDQYGYITINATSPATATRTALSSTYKMRYHTTAADPGGRLTDGYINNFTVSSLADAALIGTLIAQVDWLQIKHDAGGRFLLDPTDNANVTVSLVNAAIPVQFTLNLTATEQTVSAAGGLSASYSKGSLSFIPQLVYSASGGSNTGYPTGTVTGSVTTSQDNVTWGYLLNSTIQNRYNFKLTNNAIGFFEGTLLLTK